MCEYPCAADKKVIIFFTGTCTIMLVRRQNAIAVIPTPKQFSWKSVFFLKLLYYYLNWQMTTPLTGAVSPTRDIESTTSPISKSMAIFRPFSYPCVVTVISRDCCSHHLNRNTNFRRSCLHSAYRFEMLFETTTDAQLMGKRTICIAVLEQ